MLLKLNQIILFSLGAFFLAIFTYPFYIKLLKKLKAGKTIRENDATGQESKIFKSLHQHKAGTPNMGGGLFLLIMLIMIGISYLLQFRGISNYSLVTRSETYIILFGFFSMGLLGFLDDFLNILGFGKVKGLSAKTKLFGMFIFAGFISWWFFAKLGVQTFNFWPFGGDVNLGIFYPILTFFLTVGIVNSINITDGLDGLAGGLMIIILFVFAIISFYRGTYLTTAIIGIIIAVLLAFLRFNVNPAKIFMGDSGAYALGGFISSLIYLLNIDIGIIIPFLVLFLIFVTDTGTSLLQMISKKLFHKKLFAVAPLHHYFEHKGVKETTIVFKAWLIQGLLAAITLILMFYQINK